MVKVELRNLRKAYVSEGRTSEPVNGLSLEMPAGGITAVIGRSGCGKTTLLRLLAGLEKSDAGEIRFEHADGSKAAPRTAVVFQEHRLFPWMSVRQNVEVAVRHLPEEERRAKTDAVLALTGLTEAAGAMPCALSGGMSQRVGLARALAAAPDLLLLDEAFSSLDALTRRQLYDEFVRIHAARPVTTVLVTHDVTEAVLLSSRICRLENGVIARTYENDAPYPRSLATPGLGALSEDILRGFLEEEPLQQQGNRK